MTLSFDEASLINKLESKLKKKVWKNLDNYNYYDGRLKVKDLGVSIPKRLKNLDDVLGWASAPVDTLTERVQFDSWYSANIDDDQDLINDLIAQYKMNNVDLEQQKVAKDSFITGHSYISVGVGDTTIGEPPIIYMAESPNEVYGDFNLRTKRLDNALKKVKSEKGWIGALYLPDQTIYIAKGNNSSMWVETDRQVHDLGFIPIVPVINNPDTNNLRGRSEITKPLKSVIDSGMRILLLAEVGNAYYALPQFFLLGADASSYYDADGNPTTYMDWLAGKIKVLPADSNGQSPQMTQVAANDAGNILDQLTIYATLAAREIGLPPSYFGFDTVNPSSADAIQLADERVITKANNRIKHQKQAWKQAFAYGQIMLNGDLPDSWLNIEPVFIDPATPTPAATADRLSKLQALGVFDKDLPQWVYKELGLTDMEIAQTKDFIQKSQGNQLINTLLTQNPSTINLTPSDGTGS